MRHAHGYVPQTLADLGLIGMGLNVALLVAWLARPRAAGAGRGALARGDRALARSVAAPQPVTAERIGLMTLATTAIAFGVHSAVDWTWFVPGTAIAGLLCAAWVAGRGPLDEAPPPAAALPRGRAGWTAARGRVALAGLVLVVGLAGRMDDLAAAALGRRDEAALTALLDGRPAAGARRRAGAVGVNPLSIEPLLTLAAVQRADGQPAAARETLQRAVRAQPANPETWLRLGQFELDAGHPRRALRLLGAAIYLDPRGPEAQSAYALAQQQAAQRAR